MWRVYAIHGGSSQATSALEKIEQQRRGKKKFWFDDLIDDGEVANDALLLGGSEIGFTPQLTDAGQNFMFAPSAEVASGVCGCVMCYVCVHVLFS